MNPKLPSFLVRIKKNSVNCDLRKPSQKYQLYSALLDTSEMKKKKTFVVNFSSFSLFNKSGSFELEDEKKKSGT